MPTTTQLHPQNSSSKINVPGVAHSVTLAQGNDLGSQGRVTTFSPTVPVQVHRRFQWLGALFESNIAIPAIYGLFLPLAALRFQALWEFWFFALPVCLTIALAFARKKKRSGMLVGTLFGSVSALALNIVISLRGEHLLEGDLTSAITFFAICGAAIGTFTTGLRQGIVWLFAPNRP